METIADQLSADILILHSSGDHTGITVMDTGHGVEKVGEVGSTGIESHLCIVIGSIGMCHRHSAKLLCFFNEFLCTGQLRGDVHDPDQAAAALLQSFKACKIRLFQIIGVLSATFFVGKIRALQSNLSIP